MGGRGVRERLDFAVYFQAFFLLIRNPIIILGPLLAAVIGTVVTMLISPSGGPAGAISGGIAGLLLLIIQVFGAALAIIVADMVWRRGRTSFDEAWDETRRKSSDIVFSGLGLSMLIYVAQYIGGIFGGYFELALGALALGIFIYAIPAAAIGGVDGGGSLQASLDATRRRPLNTVLFTIIFFISYYLIGFYIPYAVFLGTGTLFVVATAFFQALALAYNATVLSKRYADIAFRDM